MIKRYRRQSYTTLCNPPNPKDHREPHPPFPISTCFSQSDGLQHPALPCRTKGSGACPKDQPLGKPRPRNPAKEGTLSASQGTAAWRPSAGKTYFPIRVAFLPSSCFSSFPYVKILMRCLTGAWRRIPVYYYQAWGALPKAFSPHATSPVGESLRKVDAKPGTSETRINNKSREMNPSLERQGRG